MINFETHIFLKLLNKFDIKYHYEGKWLVVDGDKYGSVNLSESGLITLPDYIKFNNDGYVDFDDNKLTSLPDNIEFNNSNDVWLCDNELTSLPIDLFNNGANIFSGDNKFTSLPDGIQFNNKGIINLHISILESLPNNIEEFYDRLGDYSKKIIREKFPDHWIVNKERFGL